MNHQVISPAVIGGEVLGRLLPEWDRLPFRWIELYLDK